MQYYARCTVCGRVTDSGLRFPRSRQLPTDKLCCGKYMVQAGRVRPAGREDFYAELPMLPARLLVDETRGKIVKTMDFRKGLTDHHGNPLPPNHWYLEAEMK